MTWCVGIDPGSRAAGLAAIREDGSDLKAQTVHPTGDMPARLSQLRECARRFLSPLRDDGAWCVVVERPNTWNSNTITLAAFGVLVEVAQTTLGVPVIDLGSGEWKQRVVGHGRAKEQDVMAKAKALGFDGESLDAAVAVCCADAARTLSETRKEAA